MAKLFQPINYEREILKKIKIAEHAYQITPHGNVKEAAWKELQRLYKELEELRKS